jgi:hypothetical protein
MPDVLIRPYKVSDQQAVFQIAADTAVFGEPVEAFLDDRNLFCDSFVGYYTLHKAGYCWVADNGTGVIGYLLGSTQNIIQSLQWRRYILPNLLKNVVTRRYQLGQRTVNYAVGMLVGLMKGEEPTVDLATYPAHLHINIQQGYRGGGVGRSLLNSYLVQLR